MLGDSTRLLARRGVHRWCLIPPSLPVVVSVCWRAFQALKFHSFLSQFLFPGTSKNAVERVEDQLQTQQVLDQASVLVPHLDAKAGSLNTSNRKANLEVTVDFVCCVLLQNIFTSKMQFEVPVFVTMVFGKMTRLVSGQTLWLSALCEILSGI